MKIISLIYSCLLLFAAGFLPANAQNQAEHILGPNDVIEVKVFQEPDLETRATLGQDGKVSLPLIGEMSVVGQTINTASQAIALRYKDGYLVNPNVTVAIVTYAKKRFTVLGAVTKPGSFFFPDAENLSLLQAIGMAGGYSRVANPSKVMVRRANTKEAIRIDAKKMAKSGEASTFMIKPGDVINVEESIF